MSKKHADYTTISQSLKWSAITQLTGLIIKIIYDLVFDLNLFQLFFSPLSYTVTLLFLGIPILFTFLANLILLKGINSLYNQVKQDDLFLNKWRITFIIIFLWNTFLLLAFIFLRLFNLGNFWFLTWKTTYFYWEWIYTVIVIVFVFHFTRWAFYISGRYPTVDVRKFRSLLLFGMGMFLIHFSIVIPYLYSLYYIVSTIVTSIFSIFYYIYMIIIAVNLKKLGKTDISVEVVI